MAPKGANAQGKHAMRVLLGVAALAAVAGFQVQAQEAPASFREALVLLGDDDDEFGALGLFEEACTAGYAEGCYRAGELLAGLSESDEEDAEALALVSKGCDLGFARACRDVGDELTLGEPRDEEALVKFKRGCELEDAVSCLRAGFMHHIGRGTERDLPVAREWYDRSCTLGDPAGCHAAGVTVITEQGQPGYPLARSFFERGLAIDPEHFDSKQALEQIAGF